jgi:branched-chain amino acid aminotransferase
MVASISLYSALADGINTVTVSTRKPPADALNPEVKSLNYLNSVMAKREAHLRRADEALVLNLAGKVAEASVANVFAWTEGVLVTPPSLDGALPGITRASVLSAAAELNIPTQIRSLGQAELMRADEVFLAGTGARIVPIGQYDKVAIGNSKRPIYERIEAAFTEMTRCSRPQSQSQSAAYA